MALFCRRNRRNETVLLERQQREPVVAAVVFGERGWKRNVLGFPYTTDPALQRRPVEIVGNETAALIAQGARGRGIANAGGIAGGVSAYGERDHCGGCRFYIQMTLVAPASARRAQSAARTRESSAPSATVLPMACSTGVADDARKPKVAMVEMLHTASANRVRSPSSASAGGRSKNSA